MCVWFMACSQEADMLSRADGLQPKTIETFRQMRLADPLLQRGVRVYDIAFWRSTDDEPLHRLGREVHYPPVIDVLDPYILLVHQGMVESLFIEDLKKRGVEVRRNTAFDSYSVCDGKANGEPLQINCRANVTQDRKTILAQYLVGCKWCILVPSLFLRPCVLRIPFLPHLRSRHGRQCGRPVNRSTLCVCVCVCARADKMVL